MVSYVQPICLFAMNVCSNSYVPGYVCVCVCVSRSGESNYFSASLSQSPTADTGQEPSSGQANGTVEVDKDRNGNASIASGSQVYVVFQRLVI